MREQGIDGYDKWGKPYINCDGCDVRFKKTKRVNDQFPRHCFKCLTVQLKITKEEYALTLYDDEWDPADFEIKRKRRKTGPSCK